MLADSGPEEGPRERLQRMEARRIHPQCCTWVITIRTWSHALRAACFLLKCCSLGKPLTPGAHRLGGAMPKRASKKSFKEAQDASWVQETYKRLDDVAAQLQEDDSAYPSSDAWMRAGTQNLEALRSQSWRNCRLDAIKEVHQLCLCISMLMTLIISHMCCTWVNTICRWSHALCAACLAPVPHLGKPPDWRSPSPSGMPKYKQCAYCCNTSGGCQDQVAHIIALSSGG